MRQRLMRVFYPVRKLTARFVNVVTIISKAANIIAAEKVEGDYLEFGVFAGYSFSQSYHVVKSVFETHQKLQAGRTEEDAAEIRTIWENMRFFAFDSFQGLPDPDGVDKQGREFTKGKFACTENAFRDNLVKAGVPLSKVVTVPGWFENTCTEETIRKYGMKKASIIHTWMRKSRHVSDLYLSAKTALDFVKPLLTDGTIIIFDDWYCFRGNPNRGEQRAFNEWKATMTDWTFTEYQRKVLGGTVL